MSDDAFYRPNRPASPLRQPKPGEPLWALRHDHVTRSGELRFHGESWGWEAHILREGELAIGRRFELRRLALQRAAEELNFIEAGGAFATRIHVHELVR